MVLKSAFDNSVVWSPNKEVIKHARLTEFLSQCGMNSFDALYRRSIEDVSWFTEEVIKFLKVSFNPPYAKVLDVSRGLEWAQWCVGGGLNIADACVDKQTQDGHEKRAIIWEGEEGEVRELTYAQLREEVQYCAAGLRSFGIGVGDTIAIHLPMIPETVIALLATAKIGAIAAPIFSGYGTQAIETRLQDSNAKVVFTCDGFPRRGSLVSAAATLDMALKNCPSVERVVVISRLSSQSASKSASQSGSQLNSQLETQVGTPQPRDIRWDDLQIKGRQLVTDNWDHANSAMTAAEDPLILLYTSGTTGRPKGILHAHCGFPIKAAQDMALCIDVHANERICWITDIGWMMGPWLIYGALILGATITLYDGAPDFPASDRLWAFCAKHRVNILGISPTLVRALAVHADAVPSKHDLSHLRILASTGEPWDPESWTWLFEKVGRRKLPIINYSGGTEISGGILSCNPLLPIKPCAFSAACPGIKADVVDEHATPQKIGELVIREPWIGMARGFWNNPERYLETYWSKIKNVWVHGDWASIDEDGYWFILGRSDDTLKVAGKRVGPAEIEAVLASHEQIVEAAVVGVPDKIKGTKMIAFCVAGIINAGAEEREALSIQLRKLVGRAMGKPLVPDKIFIIGSLPKTRNGKIMRRVIRAVYLGEDAGDLSALENSGINLENIEIIRRFGSQEF